ncbi:hypothetical protein AUC69_11130 [Methyloceanibacter superfactus]|uniref:Uncharacterized protein n=1 Tax=Methyloceanibacter superfactus TaxID=1774969 RepID=A0A1E3VVV6_9HYPH|nr:hypothetical protein [Methyloceanibacter superfactus]ODR97655.1 hypothetical protein AUC69_11130 [Methyloceanibacter superfactus]
MRRRSRPVPALAAPDTPAAEAPAAAEAAPAPAAETKTKTKTMRVVYLGKKYDEPLPLSYAEKVVTDKGIQGARLMLKEANQAGNFVGFSFELIEEILPKDGDIVAVAKEALANGDRFFIADLEPDDLLAVADLPAAKDAVIMNIRSSATKLRQASAATTSSTSFPTTPCAPTLSRSI